MPDLIAEDCIQTNVSYNDNISQSTPTPGPILNDREVAISNTNPRVIVTSTIIESAQSAFVSMNDLGGIDGFPITLQATTTYWRNYPEQSGFNWSWYYTSNADNIKHVFEPQTFSSSKIITEELFNTHRGTGTEVTYTVVWEEHPIGFLESAGTFTITLSRVGYTTSTSVLPVIEEFPTSVNDLAPITVPEGFGTEIFYLKMLLGDVYKYVPYVKYGAPYIFEIDTSLSTTGAKIGPFSVNKEYDDILEEYPPLTCTIDWGDATISTYTEVLSIPEHTYAAPGIYTIKIYCAENNINYIYFGSGEFPTPDIGNRKIVTKIKSFGSILGKYMLSWGYFGFTNLIEVPKRLPGNIINLDYVFHSCANFNSNNVTYWNTSNVTTMYGGFYGCTVFNQDISIWNVSNVTNMSLMFYQATAFNQNISSWNTIKVTEMFAMFYQATIFNQSIASWNVSNVTNMGSMFSQAIAFNQDLSSWNTSKVTNMYAMFSGATAFNGNISSWNTSNVEFMGIMFNNAVAFNQNISNWNVSKVISQEFAGLQYMFAGASVFNQDLSGWCVSAHLSMPIGFANATPAWTLPKPVWGTCP